MTDTERKGGMGPAEPALNHDTDQDLALIERLFEEADEREIDTAQAEDALDRIRLCLADAVFLPPTESNTTADMKAALEWQPIETAPKDGRFIDVWIGGDIEQRYTDVQWRVPTESEFWSAGSEEPDASKGEFGPEPGFFDCHGLKLQGGLYPTHWRLPPEPPAALSNHGEKK